MNANEKPVAPPIQLRAELPKQTFQPLKAQAHPRQREMDAYRAIPSLVK